jgi:hypothetical protein
VLLSLCFQKKKHSYSAATNQGIDNVGAIGLMVFEEEIIAYPTTIPYASGGSIRSMDNMVFNSCATLESSVGSSAGLNVPVADDQFSLGTTWGNEITHKVKRVSFNRANKLHPNNIITIYYDTRQALEARGIRLLSNSVKRFNAELPNPFPGYTGCTPPPGWRK